MIQLKWLEYLNEQRNKRTLLLAALVINAAGRQNKSNKMGVYNSQNTTAQN